MKINMINKKFGRLTVIQETERTKDNHIKWLCKCDCGNNTIVDGRDLRKGSTKSCGCLLKERTKKYKFNLKHGDQKTRLYHIWQNMLDRCRRKKNKNYKNYGGRGIKVCEEWFDYICFKNWSIENGYKDNLTIDRINNNGNYEPNNCRWITIKEQQNNKRTNHYITYNNETHTITEWNNMLGFKRGLIFDRLSKGWTIERALTEKPFIGKNQNFRKIQKRY